LRIAKFGSILISVRAPVGTTNRADRDYCIGRGLGAVLAKPGITDDLFLLHAIQANLNFLHRRSQGSTFLAVSSKDLLSMPIAAPSLATQRRIADILSTVDETIAQTEALIAKYQQIKAGLMHDLFTRGVTADGLLRPTREHAPELYEESQLGSIPKHWGTYPISVIADSLVDGPFGSNLKTEHYVVESGVRVVRLQNIQEGRYNDSDRAFVSQQHADYLARNTVHPGDVLVAALGEDNYPVGRACCYPDELPPAINKADCYRLRCKSEIALNAYMGHFLNTVAARNQVRRFEQGVTRRRTNLGNFRRVIVALPDIEEQIRIVDLLTSASSCIESAEMVVAKLRQQKLGLMHDLLTGRVRVKQPESETERV